MPLSDFHISTRTWFENTLGNPTEAQSQAWPCIKNRDHTLIAAPTGSGKTLAAFYAAIDDLIARGLANVLTDQTHVLYISPLKALSNDIHRNLEVPLAGIKEELTRLNLPKIDITVAVRSGDTSQSERQKMIKKPPHILVTTPESFYLLLTSDNGRNMLKSVQTLIVDEIHALLGDKRGSHLALSIERLEALLENPLQRIGLSATQKPIETVAKFLVGNKNICDGKPNCKLIDTGLRRKLELSLEVPQSPLTAVMSNEAWSELYKRLVELIGKHETTLIFVNTRRLAERLALALADQIGEDHVSSHHGSMSKEHRHSAEQRLKVGKLKVLVATASMELGIDIGSVDLVVQFASPKSIAAFIQRVGRSGHSVGGTPKGILFPLTREDLVECAALLDCVRRGELDKIKPPEKPLDILAQQIIAEVSGGEWDIDALYKVFSSAFSYRDLSEGEFFSIIKMLSEGFTTRRGRRGAFLYLDAINNRVKARKNARLTALTNGGAIPDMFDYNVVLDPENIVVGSLNEDFALESLPGDIFALGSHCWQMIRIEGLNVRVRDAKGMPPTIPFWFGEGPGRTRELSEAVSRLRSEISRFLDDDTDNGDARKNRAAQWLVEEIGLTAFGAEQLVLYLLAGQNALGGMPTRERIVLERFFDEVGDTHIVVHSPFGSRVNKGWGLALRKRLCRAFNFELQAAANEDSIVISLGSVHSFALDEVFGFLKEKTLRDVLSQALLDAPMFEVRWRWNATRALAIQRNRSGKRVPPQLQRMQAEDLVAQVFPDQIACLENIQGAREIPDHPLVKQTVHDCLTEAMDIEELEELISKVENKELEMIAKDLREPSPFAQEIINARPYAFLDDAPFEERRTNAIRNRRWLDPKEASEFGSLDGEAVRRVQEEAWPDVRNVDELHDALLLLGFMTEEEGDRGDGENSYAAFFEILIDFNRATKFIVNQSTLWIAAERLTQFKAVFEEFEIGHNLELPDWLEKENWSKEFALREIVRGRLEGLGPVTVERLAQDIGLPEKEMELALLALETEGFAFRGHYTPGSEKEEWCERRLLQRIHRYTIDIHRRSVQPVSLQDYMRFLFDRHEVSMEPLPTGLDSLEKALGRLEGITTPAAAWEADILPARIDRYDPNWLDMLCMSGSFVWGRFYHTKTAINESKRSGAIKSTPINLLSRNNMDIWRALMANQKEPLSLSSNANLIRNDLDSRGASFFNDIVKRTRLLKTQVEEGIGELVAAGRVTSDNFTGLRALLTPSSHKLNGNRSRRTRTSVYGMERAGRWSLISTETEIMPLDNDQMERLIFVYLKRWGVLFKQVLEKEVFSPPWRILVQALRRMELKGEIRGGRFVAGAIGEQFALPETVDRLRQISKEKKRSQLLVLAASDPLNMLGIILPGKKVARVSGNRVLYRDGIPIALLEAKEIKYLADIGDGDIEIQQALIRRTFPPALRAYLGKSYR